MKDLINTREFELHKTFFFSCLVGILFSVITWGILSFHIDFVYSFVYDALKWYTFVWWIFILFTLLNNIYQVIAHVFTATTFSGFYWFVPPGSHKRQSLMIFTMSNVLDIVGWMCVFIYYRKAHPFPTLLAATHYGSGIVSILFNKTFQKYYIDNCNQKKDDNDPFRFWIWKLFKVSFVATDAVVRGWYSWNIIHDLVQ